jgi:outer membrane protein assembly factor BamE (lipoprotein component of BamABCDE complex)
MRRIYLLLACVVAACTHGRDFAKPTPEALVLGHTTTAEVEGRYGRPYRQSRAIRSDDGERAGYVPATPFAAALTPGTFASFTYLYTDTTSTVLYGGAATAKAIVFIFWNDTLVSYNYISTFNDSSSSNFDEGRIAGLKRGEMTRANIIELLGEPTGRAIYPQIRDQGTEAFVYDYVQFNRRERRTKTLVILFGGDGTLQDFRFGSDDQPIAPPATNYTPVPIVLPPVHK